MIFQDEEHSDNDELPSYDDIVPKHKTVFIKSGRWPDGEGIYVGELDWKGRRSGQGKMEWISQNRVYQGSWVTNQMEGFGCIWWRDTGSYYAGNWKKGAMHGKGRMVWGPKSQSPGRIYYGEFRYIKN